MKWDSQSKKGYAMSLNNLWSQSSSKKRNMRTIKSILSIFTLILLVFVSCDFSPTERPSAEDKLRNEGYVLLELDGVSNIWYKNISENITRYIQQDEFSHRAQSHLDIYFYIEVDSSDNIPYLVIKSITKSDSYSETFLPKYVSFQKSSKHSTSNAGKAILQWGEIVYSRFTTSFGYGKYHLYCESTVINDSDYYLNGLIDMIDSEEYIYYYFDNGYIMTDLKLLPKNYPERIRDTLYTFVNHKDKLIFRN